MPNYSYGLSNSFSSLSPNLLGNGNFQIFQALVKKVIFETEDLLKIKQGYKPLGAIRYENFGTKTKIIDNLPLAYPFFPNFKQYPTENEIVLIIKSVSSNSQGNDSNQFDSYYISSINLWNNPHNNILPYIETKTSEKNYFNTSQGIIRKNDNQIPQITFGKNFTENNKIKPLYPFQGDVIFEGRYGNSIRFGNTQTKNNLSPWSKEGKDGDPIIIIRNGQSISSDEFIPTIENINDDSTSLYMCDGQKIPIIVSSTNLQTFNVILNNVKNEPITLANIPFLTSSLSSSLIEDVIPFTSSFIPETSSIQYQEDLITTFTSSYEQPINEEDLEFIFDYGKPLDNITNPIIKSSDYNPLVFSNVSDSNISNSPLNGGSGNGVFLNPIEGKIISDYGSRPDPKNPSKNQFHYGIDIPSPLGTPIYSPTSGKILFGSQGPKIGYGNFITIIPQNSPNTQIILGHLSGFYKSFVQNGNIEKGQLIGFVGSTGDSTGNHLHITVNVNGSPVDPKPYFKF